MDYENLSPGQARTVEKLSNSSASIRCLLDVFPDPGEAYVCSPVPMAMRELSHLYSETVPEPDRHRFITALRKRCREERWVEQRAVFQARRTAARKDAIIEAEAQVWAIIGLEFHQKRMRSLTERWEALDAYVMEQLEKCEVGDRVFGTDLRDACRELESLEDSLTDIMPTMGIPARAQRFWSAKAGTREEMVGRIEEKLLSVVGGSRASNVFELVRNAEDS